MNDKLVHNSSPKQWGGVTTDGAEIWDTPPVFLGEQVVWKDWLKLLFYPKKWFLYRWIRLASRQVGRYANRGERDLLKEPFRILDVGCGTGATLVDFKKMFGRSSDVVGIDVVRLQVDLAREKMKQYGVWAEVEWYDGVHIPFPDNSFDAIYTSDVFGHVERVPEWLRELHRVLRPGGVLAMFNESKLGKHAYIRRYLFDRGLNVDPHAEFHISLYSKLTQQEMIEAAGFEILSMRTAFWASFFVHPDEFYEKLQGQNKFFFLRLFNRVLYWLKKKTHPYSTAVCELYGLLEMYAVGKWVEAQGYVVLGRKLE